MKIQDIHYKVEGKGPSIVLLHGFLEDMTMWDEFTAPLITDYTVVRIDLLGHGKTTSQDAIYSMEEQAEIVHFVLEKEHISEAVIVGHSMGGYVALAFAEQYPQMTKGFSLFFSSAAEDNSEKKTQRNRVAELVKTQRESFIRVAIPNLFHNEEQESLQPWIKKTKEMAQKVSTENIIASIYGMRSRKDRIHILRTYVPKQLLVGLFDTALDQKSLQKQIDTANNLDYKTFNVGHMGHYEAHEETFRELKKFIEKCYS